jgi:hypothetical protein
MDAALHVLNLRIHAIFPDNREHQIVWVCELEVVGCL